MRQQLFLALGLFIAEGLVGAFSLVSTHDPMQALSRALVILGALGFVLSAAIKLADFRASRKAAGGETGGDGTPRRRADEQKATTGRDLR